MIFVLVSFSKMNWQFLELRPSMRAWAIFVGEELDFSNAKRADLIEDEPELMTRIFC